MPKSPCPRSAGGEGGWHRRVVQGTKPAVRNAFGLALVLATVVVLLGGAGCSRKIGDDCTTPTECDPNQTRVCDLSQPGGYCTILGCDETTCPEEAVCIRFFPAKYLTIPCDPSQPTSVCSPDELCLPSGLCAARSAERRSCVLGCSGNDDCRDGYECRRAGLGGSVLLSADPNAQASFCAPRVSN